MAPRMDYITLKAKKRTALKANNGKDWAALIGAPNHCFQCIVGIFMNKIGLIPDCGFNIAMTVKLLQHLNRYRIARKGGKGMP